MSKRGRAAGCSGRSSDMSAACSAAAASREPARHSPRPRLRVRQTRQRTRGHGSVQGRPGYVRGAPRGPGGRCVPASSAATKRSSPHQKLTLDQSTAGARRRFGDGLERADAHRPAGKHHRRLAVFVLDVHQLGDQAGRDGSHAGRSSRDGCLLWGQRSLGRTLLRLVRGSPIVITSPKLRPDRGSGDLGEAVLQAAARQGDALGGLAGLRQFGHIKLAGTVGCRRRCGSAGTPPDSGAGGVRDDRDRCVQGEGEPRGQQDGAGRLRGAAPSTATAVTGEPSTWSSTAASWSRQRVRRVQAKSVSPGRYVRQMVVRAACGSARAESVIRR